MKKILGMAVLFMAAISSSCSSDSGSSSSSGDLYMKFKVNGVQHNYGNDDVQTIRSLSTSISILGDEADNFRSLTLWMPNNKTTGSHPIVHDDANLETTYQATYGTDTVSVDATSGTLKITHMDSDYIEGTFSFSGVDSETANPYTVTEGKFRAYNITE